MRQPENQGGDMVNINEREVWIDTLRGVATLLILLLHATLILRDRHGLEPWELLVLANSAFAPFRMPALMFISGVLLKRALDKPREVYLWRKVRTLLFPYVLWSAVYGLIMGDIVSVSLWLGGSYLWFILFLFAYFLLAWPLRMVNPLLVVAALVFLSALSPEDSKYAERLFILMAYFFLGSAVAQRKKAFCRSIEFPLVVISMISAVILSVIAVENEQIRYRAEFFPLIAASLPAVVLGSMKLAKTRIGLLVSFVGRNAVVFFTTHYPIIYIVSAVMLAFEVTHVSVLTAASFVVAMAAGWALAVARSRSGFLEFLYVLPGRLYSDRRRRSSPAAPK